LVKKKEAFFPLLLRVRLLDTYMHF